MRREWYVYAPVHKLVLSGYATETDAREEASRILREWPEAAPFEILHRDHPCIVEYARTHTAWAKREGFASTSSGEQESRIEEETGWWEEYYAAAEDPEKAKKLREREEEIARKHGLPLEDFSLELAEQLGAKYPPTIRSWDEYWEFVEDLAKRKKEEWAESEEERTSPSPCGSRSPEEVVTDDVYIEVGGETVGRMGRMRIALTDGDRGRLMDGREVVKIKDKWIYRPRGAASQIYGQKIYWRDIPEGASVDLIGGEYYYKGKLVFWHGQEAAEAQHMLEGMRGQVAPSTVCPVCGDPVAGGPDEYLEHIKTKHPEEWHRLETDPSYTLRRAEAGPRQLAPIVRQLPTVTIRKKKYYLDARLREYRAVDDPHDRIPLEPEYAKLLDETSEGSVAWNAVVESIIEEKQREAERRAVEKTREALPW